MRASKAKCIIIVYQTQWQCVALSSSATVRYWQGLETESTRHTTTENRQQSRSWRLHRAANERRSALNYKIVILDRLPSEKPFCDAGIPRARILLTTHVAVVKWAW